MVAAGVWLLPASWQSQRRGNGESGGRAVATTLAMVNRPFIWLREGGEEIEYH